ncbi:MAG: serine hydrolase domain-containing protein, partial [Actinomycetota bacterium]
RQLHSRGLTPEGVRAAFIASERERPIGAGYAYSDLGYLLLGEVVRTVTGASEAEFAQERIFSPLGMGSTRYLPPAEGKPRLAATRCPDRGRVLLGEVHDGNCDALGGVAGHAGLFGAASDLLTYATMLLEGGELNGVRVLSPLAVRQMATNQNPTGLNGHTLGWFARPNGYLPAGDFLPAGAFRHTVFTGTSLVISPSLGLAVTLLTNRVYQEREATEFIRFRRRFHNAVAGLLR